MLETVGFLHLKSESLDLAIDKFTKSHQNRTGFNKGEDFISDSISLQYIHNVLTLARVNHVKKDPKAVRFWGLIAREYLQRTCGMSKLTLIDPSYQPIELIIDSGDN